MRLTAHRAMDHGGPVERRLEIRNERADYDRLHAELLCAWAMGLSDQNYLVLGTGLSNPRPWTIHGSWT